MTFFIIVLILLLFYAPVFTLTVLGIILVLGIIGGILFYKTGKYAEYKERKNSLNCFGLWSVLNGISDSDKSNDKTSYKKHHGKCKGDCANCPPHYGYRYGRWYYGHDHIEGCEFGGNKGSGGRD